MTKVRELTKTLWEIAADEIEAEAQVRGDLDERTVHALAGRLRTLGNGYDVSHREREQRKQQRKDRSSHG